ncbi:MAG: hypothetical protein Q7J59_01495 [Elusimicrobiota bacterium]|nr:hypothetical protein [Elusimicrobiota bacterium]
MRKLFIVVAKFMGFWMFYSAFWGFTHVGLYLDMLVSLSDNTNSILWSLAGMVLSMASSFILGWLLLIKTEWLADKLKISEGNDLPVLNADSVLKTGIKLIGIHVAVFAIPKFVSSFYYYQFNFAFVAKLFAFFVSMGLGIFLAVKTEKVIKVISGNEGKAG